MFEFLKILFGINPVIDHEGEKTWYCYGNICRKNGPAIIRRNGDQLLDLQLNMQMEINYGILITTFDNGSVHRKLLPSKSNWLKEGF